MIKSFVSHLRDNKKVYAFKMRMAFECSDKMFARIEQTLDAYQLESITKPKSLPIQEDEVNFPKLGPVEINVIEMELGYPAIAEMIETLLVERCGLDKSAFVVHSAAQETYRTPQIGMYEAGTALLDTELEDMQLQEKVYGNEFITDFLDSIETRQFDITGANTEKAVTTNDLAPGTLSPMTNQNKLPTAKDI